MVSPILVGPINKMFIIKCLFIPYLYLVPSERLELSRTMFTDPSNQPVYQFQHDGKFPYFLGISCIVEIYTFNYNCNNR